MAIAFLAAGTEWFRDRLEGVPLEAGERAFLVTGESHREIRSLRLGSLSNPTHSLLRRPTLSWSDLEVVPARHLVVGAGAVRLVATVPPAAPGIVPKRVVMLRFTGASRTAGGKTLMQGPVLEGERGRDGVAVTATYPATTVRRMSPTEIPINIDGPIHIEWPQPIFIPTLPPPQPSLEGCSVLDVWRLAHDMGGVRLSPEADVATMGRVGIGFVTAQQGPSGGMRARIALNDSDDLTLLPGIGPATVARLASNPRPVRTLGDIAFLTQSRYRTLGIRAGRAKHLSRLAVLMTMVTGTGSDGAKAAEVVMRALKWMSRGQLESLLKGLSRGSFLRRCSSTERAMMRMNELDASFSSRTRETWWNALQRLLKVSTDVID
jgi:hypothetical protein